MCMRTAWGVRHKVGELRQIVGLVRDKVLSVRHSWKTFGITHPVRHQSGEVRHLEPKLRHKPKTIRDKTSQPQYSLHHQQLSTPPLLASGHKKEDTCQASPLQKLLSIQRRLFSQCQHTISRFLQHRFILMIFQG